MLVLHPLAGEPVRTGLGALLRQEGQAICGCALRTEILLRGGTNPELLVELRDQLVDLLLLLLSLQRVLSSPREMHLLAINNIIKQCQPLIALFEQCQGGK
jgi:hypothetical protein